MLRSLSGLAFFLFAVMASAEECPTLEGDQRLELLEQAATCEKALALFEICSYGAGADVGLSEIVISKCEGDFLTGLDRAQQRAYAAEQGRCERKYRNQPGSMYRSFEAFCSAKLAKTYAQRFGRSPKP